MASSHPSTTELRDYADRLTPAPRRAAIERHLKACGACNSLLDDMVEPTRRSGGHPTAGPDHERTQNGDPLLGQMLGEYRVLERLGQGGMGVVYRGEQPLIGKPVAIKVMLPEIASDTSLVERMLAEARAVNAVRHPNIIDVFAFGFLPDQRPYMVMELLQGESLAVTLNLLVRLTVSQTLVVLSQTMAALEAAHAVGVVHRDLKPDNIFVDRQQDGWKLTLLDFGLATREGAKNGRLTSPGLALGTPGFMAPEQVRGVQDITAKADIYSMGVVAWTLLAGREPFQGGSAVEVMHRHLTTPAPPLAAEAPDVPPELEALVMQMLDKVPERRPISTDVRRLANRLLQRPVTDPEGIPVQRKALAAIPAAGGKSRSAVAVMLGIGVAVVLGVGGLWLSAGPSVADEPSSASDLRPIARPPSQENPPALAPAEKASVAPPVVSPVVSPERVPSLGRTWPCRHVAEVSAVMHVMSVQRSFFVLAVENEPITLITANGDGPELKSLKRLRETVKACRFTDQVIKARRINGRNLTMLTDKGVFKTGIEIIGEDLSVEPPPP